MIRKQRSGSRSPPTIQLYRLFVPKPQATSTLMGFSFKMHLISFVRTMWWLTLLKQRLLETLLTLGYFENSLCVLQGPETFQFSSWLQLPAVKATCSYHTLNSLHFTASCIAVHHLPVLMYRVDNLLPVAHLFRYDSGVLI